MSDATPVVRRRNTPTVEALKPQGENRFLARVHVNSEYKTTGGLYIPDTHSTQDNPTTGDVLRVTDCFDTVKFPDIKPGMCVKVTMNGWSFFKIDGVAYAIGSAANVIAAYDPSEFCQDN